MEKKERMEKAAELNEIMEKITEALPKRLEALRKENGLTLIELGKELPLPKSTIFRYETLETVPTIDALALYGKRFGITIQELVFGEASQSTETADALYPIIMNASEKSVRMICGLLEIAEDYVNCLETGRENFVSLTGRKGNGDSRIAATTLGGRLRELRKSIGCSQEDVEECTGLLEKNFTKYERELTTPPLKVFVFYAKFFGITIDRLYYGDYPKISEQFRLLSGCLARVSCDFHSLAKKMFMFASEQNLFETWLD